MSSTKLKKKKRTVRTATSLWVSQHVVLDHPLVALLYKNIAYVAHLHRKLKIFGTTWLQFLKLKVFNTMMHTITNNQVNLFLYKRISDMCTVMFKELSTFDISCIIWSFNSGEDSSFGLLRWDHVCDYQCFWWTCCLHIPAEDECSVLCWSTQVTTYIWCHKTEVHISDLHGLQYGIPLFVWNIMHFSKFTTLQIFQLEISPSHKYHS
jgi:hypothetical protein